MTSAPRRRPWHPVPRPFVKWVGGKRQLLGELSRRIPKTYGTYHEPFVGGGALFFHLKPPSAVLYDRNRRLIRAYRGIKRHVDEVIAQLSDCHNDKEFYLSLRDYPIDDGSDADVAAWLIYLNKTGFNGLYRVNKSDGFNVPFGRYKNPNICDERNLRACAEALANVELLHEDFDAVLDRAVEGDLVYFDPPYVPLSKTSNFTSYTRESFDLDDQQRLRDAAQTLKQRGVHVLLSNSSAPEVRELYADGFRCRKVMVARSVNCKSDGRGKIPELLIW